MEPSRSIPLATALVAVGFLEACGGSTGPPPNKPPTASFTATPASGPPPLAVSFDASGSSDDDGSIRTYAWDFGNGATASGRTVDHTYEDSGAFQVRLTVTDDDGSQASANEELVVNLPPTARISTDPVDGEAPITVTFDSAESADGDGEIVSYQWVVANGAPTDGAMIEHTFDEPGVYAVRLTVTDDLGGTAEAVIEMNVRDDAGVAYTVPYLADGPYADELRPCTYGGETLQTTCTLGRLPFLGQEFGEPTVDDLMSRVLVSHRWMGDSLEKWLLELPADVRLLARSVTAIVIASDIRPAYYSPSTGAIYLDADFFWETPEEYAVITMEEDYRSDFGSAMQLRIPWRIVRNNVPLWLTAGGERASRSDWLLPFLAFLLYHELSHAADFMPASGITSALDANLTPWEAMFPQFDQWPSTVLATQRPLRSSAVWELAQVFFGGADPTAEQLAMLPDDLVDAFVADGGVDFYSYSSRYEDLADLHDSILMSYHHGFEKDIAIVGVEGELIADSVVAWGQRGRMTDPNVIDRLRLVIDQMYPGDLQELHGYLDGRPAPLPMRRGDTWAENRQLEGGEDFNPDAPPIGKQALSFEGAIHGQPFATWRPVPPHPDSSANEKADPRLRGAQRMPPGRARVRPELLGCIRVDGGLKEELDELIGRR